MERGREALRARGAALVLVERRPDDPDAGPALRPVRADGLPDNLLRALRDAAGSQLAAGAGAGRAVGRRSTNGSGAAQPGVVGGDGRRPGCRRW